MRHDREPELANASGEAVGQTPGRDKPLERVGEAPRITKQVVARFKAERQALAMMDPPNIAKATEGRLSYDAESWQREAVAVFKANGISLPEEDAK
jgi:hypothetical protein